jgi:hypothetical protein
MARPSGFKLADLEGFRSAGDEAAGGAMLRARAAEGRVETIIRDVNLLEPAE